MALLKTIDEVKSVLRISNLDDQSSLPDIESAEEKYIIPWIGKELYDELNAGYNADPVDLSPAYVALINKIHKPLAAFAYYDDLGVIHAKITDAGIRRMTSDGMPSAYRWEVDEVKNVLLTRAFDGLESLLNFLELKAADYPSWVAGTGYQRRNRYMIKSGNDFSEQFTLYHPLRTYHALTAVMADVEKLYVDTLIGADFFESLKNIAVATPEEKPVISDLKKGIAYFTIMHAAEKLPVRVGDAGFTVASAVGTSDAPDATRQHAPDNILSLLITSCRRDGNSFLLKAKEYLDKHASLTLFPTYFNSGYYVKPEVTEPTRRTTRRIFNL